MARNKWKEESGTCYSCGSRGRRHIIIDGVERRGQEDGSKTFRGTTHVTLSHTPVPRDRILPDPTAFVRPTSVHQKGPSA